MSASGDGLRVYVSRAGLYLGSERQSVVGLGPDAAKEGYAASNKNNPNEFLVPPLVAALRARRESRQAKVLLFADESTPYRVLIETLFNLAQGGYEHFLLVGQHAASAELVGLETSAPSKDDAGQIVIIVVNFGYSLHVNNQRVGADCGNGPQEGMSVPRVGAQLDPVGLGVCLRRWLSTVSVPSVIIVANPTASLTDVLATAETVAIAGASFGFRVSK